jgi:hypothetical protein
METTNRPAAARMNSRYPGQILARALKNRAIPRRSGKVVTGLSGLFPVCFSILANSGR